MANFLLIGAVAFLYIKILCPEWKLCFSTIGLAGGLKKYGVIGTLVAIVGFVAFYVGLMPFDSHPSVAKVLVEGVIYYIGVATIEELYVRGFLLNFIEKICAKRKKAHWLLSFYRQ